MPRAPRWLTGSIVGVIAATTFLSVGWWGACTFYIGPKIWIEYVRSEGKRPTAEPKVCEDADARALQVLTGLLATLLGLMSNPPSDDRT
jgi:hypothetical protein